MKNITIVILLILLSYFTNCNKNSSEFTKTLTSDSCLWNFFAFDNEEYNFLYNYQFFKNHTYDNYFSDNPLEKGFNLDEFNIDSNNKKDVSYWNFNEVDSTFSLGQKEFTYKVVKYNKDSIFLKGKGYKGKFLMVKLNNIK